MSKATWDDLVRVVRGLTQRQNGPPVRGNFTINDEQDLASLNACLNSQADTHLILDDGIEPNSLNIGQTITIEISPRFGFGLLVSNIEQLLIAQYAKVKAPPHFFLLEEGINHSDQVSEDHPIAKYHDVLNFIQMLKGAAAFLDPEEPALIFINEGKFEVPINYTAQDLDNLSLTEIKILTHIIQKDTHEKQCNTIMAEAIVGMTRYMSSDVRFKYILANLSDLKKNYEDGFNLFASGFSYEKVRDQVEAARVEYTGKIHKVLSDIQNQLLSIPVATIVVATQMKEVKAMDANFWVNSAVLFGCWVFSILIAFLLHNQSITLKVLQDEINRQKDQLNKEYALVAKSFESTFKALTKRALLQRIIIWSVDVIVAVGFLSSNFVYFKLTLPAHAWLVTIFPWLTLYI